MVDAKKIVWILAAVLICMIFSMLSPPKGLDPVSMRYVGIFIAMLILLISQALADWIVSMFVLGIMAATHIDNINMILAPFSQSTIWLVFGVLAMAVGITNSGILQRITLKILTLFPATYKGMVLAMICSSIVMTPLISSTIAKSGMLAPIATNITENCGLKERTRGALGIFLAAFIPSYFLGNIYISGSANVGIMMGFMKDMTFDYVGWTVAGSIWGLALIIGTYLFCMTYCKPKKDDMGVISTETLKKYLTELGPMTKQEKNALVILGLALLTWITQSVHGIDTGTVAVLAAATLAAVGLFEVKDLMGRLPWNLILFIAMLLSVSSEMTSLGVSKWLSVLLSPLLSPILSSPWIFIPSLCIIVFLLRLVIVSNLATLTILLAIFGPLMAQTGMSMYVLVFVAYMCGSMWNVDYQNPLPLTALAAAGGRYVTFTEFRLGSFLFMVICLVSFTASIPLWQIIGLLK